MNKFQARLLISIVITVVMVIAGTGALVDSWGIQWGLLGFMCSAFAGLMVVFLFNVIALFYDELGDKE